MEKTLQPLSKQSFLNSSLVSYLFLVHVEFINFDTF